MQGCTLSLSALAALLLAGAPLDAAPVTYELPPETAQLRPGAGRDVAQNVCTACHSVDYIAIQPPKKGKAFWDAEVAKMSQVYKAEIDPKDAKTIADYLAAAY